MCLYRREWFPYQYEEKLCLESCWNTPSGKNTSNKGSYPHYIGCDYSRCSHPPFTQKAGATKTETKEGKDKQKKEDVEAEAAVEEEQENEDVEQYWPDDDKPAPKGTTSAHYIKFISEVLDVMDEIGNMEGYYLVMDNCSIHKNKYLQRKIIRRCYNYMYLPAYSLELNPIENFWSLIKGKMKRVFFAVGETMMSRIRAACEDTSILFHCCYFLYLKDIAE